ncbi:MAG: response regulator transcription factor [Arcicella sp.]|nr:response regulator transcription factor [Arcicella sp.]
MNSTSIIIAKQEKIMVEAIKNALINEGYEVKATSSSFAETLEILKKHNPDLLILGCELSGMSNLKVLENLSVGANTKVVLYTRNTDLEEALTAIKKGVMGYLNTDTDLEELLTCVKAVLNGSKFLCHVTRNALFLLDNQQPAKPIKNNKLSDQENRVMNLLAEGKTNDEIADILNIASNTVNNHRANIRKKLDLKGGKSILLQYAISQKNYYG